MNVFTRPKPVSKFPKRFEKKRNPNFVKMHKTIGRKIQEIGNEIESEQYLDMDHRAIQQIGRLTIGAAGGEAADGVESVGAAVPQQPVENGGAGLQEGPKSGP